MRKSNCLSARKIARLTEPGRYPHGRVPGLLFQKSLTGGRSWVLRYRSIDGRQRMMGLGRYELVSVELAEELAKAAWRKILNGIDPLAEKEQRMSGGSRVPLTITFKEAATAYIDVHEAGWKSAKHADQWTATLTSYAYPFIGEKPVNEITTAYIMEILQQDYEGKTLWVGLAETGNRLRQRIEAVLDWATASGFRTGDNPARWRGHLSKLLPSHAKVAKRQHQPALDYRAIPSLMAELGKRQGVAAKALQITVLVGARTNEITKARWREIDFENKIWTVPAERMKTSREHRVPLSPRAIEILKSLPTEAGNDFIFIGSEAGKPISNAAMHALLKRMALPSTTPGKLAVVHGMRSSFRDWAAECTNFPRELCEAALAHVVGDKTEKSYQRGDLLERRRKLMDAWTAYCFSPVRTGKVVQFGQRGKKDVA
jgi:integrase